MKKHLQWLAIVISILVLIVCGLPGAIVAQTASISGMVYESTGNSPLTGVEIGIAVFQGDPCGLPFWFTSASTDAMSGTYSITGLPAGTYYLQTQNYGANYLNEWWATPTSTVACGEAQAITVSEGETVTDRNFQLDAGATISGIIYHSDNATPITGTMLGVQVIAGDPCGTWSYSWSTSVDSMNGAYTITGLPAGTYYLQTQNYGANYLNEWWAAPASVRECTAAQAITVVEGQIYTGRNFQLDAGATISGIVYHSDNATPITGTMLGVQVIAGDPCGTWSYSWSTSVDSMNGTYTITGLPAGTYYLQTQNYGAADYFNEWWATPGSVRGCAEAQVITVAEGQTYLGKNFQLDSGAIISGTLYQTDGVTPVDLSSGWSSVYLYSGTPCDSPTYVTNVGIDSSTGAYTITGLSSGTYYLWAEMSNTPYFSEWWAAPDSVRDCSAAQAITITEGQTVTGRNFRLDTGATISGTLYQTDGVTPVDLSSGWASVYLYSGTPCDAPVSVASVWVDSSTGAYTVTRLPAGSYYLWAEMSNTPYFSEWWASPDSMRDCSAAQAITVSEGQTYPDRNFQLDVGAVISGTVFESDGNTPLTGISVGVNVVQGDPCGMWTWITNVPTDSTSGTYTVTGLPAGTYYLQTQNYGTNYFNEWWAMPNSTQDCNGAQSITVTEGQTATGRDFQLDAGATISGTVYESDGHTPITGVTLGVLAITGDPCGSWNGWSVSTDAMNGTYTITGLPAGTYYLQTQNNGANYFNEWWAVPDSTRECSEAQSITITEGQTLTERNFQLDVSATISGHLYQSDGVTPVNLDGGWGWVNVYSGDPCGSASYIDDAYVDAITGAYTVTELPAGTYYLQTQVYGANYFNEWWAAPDSKPDCSAAQSITVAEGQTVTERNFQLDPGAVISGTVYQSDNLTPVNLAGGYASVEVYSGIPCGSLSYRGSASINAMTGSYTVTALPAGTYYLKTNMQANNYINEWWAAPASVFDCSMAQSITVTEGDTVIGRNFQLEPGAQISGVVYQTDGITPLIEPDIDISAYTGDPCGTPAHVKFGMVSTLNGAYTIVGLPAGTYYLRSFDDNDIGPNPVPYSSEWWAAPHSTRDCSGAQAVTVTNGGIVVGKDFQLDPGSPEIQVQQGSTILASGSGSYNYGNLTLGSATPITFTIRNLGELDLTLTGTPRVQIGGTNMADFTVTQQPAVSTVPPIGGSTTFIVQFAPQATGTRTATVSIANNDNDENPYTFTVTGTGQAVASQNFLLWTK